MAKKRKGRKHRSAAQKRAFKKMIAALHARRGGKKVKRHRKRKARKVVKVVHHKRRRTHVAAPVTIKREYKPMARKKHYSRKRRGGFAKQDIKHTLMTIGGGVGGAVIGAAVASKIPVDAKIKPIIPLIGGLVLPMVFKRNRIVNALSVGMAIAGAMALVKQHVPQIPVLAGDDETDVARRLMLGEASPTNLLGVTENIAGEDLLGVTDNIAGEDLLGEDLLGEESLLGEDE